MVMKTLILSLALAAGPAFGQLRGSSEVKKDSPASLDHPFRIQSGTSGSTVASYWKKAGGSSATCQTAVAVSNAESNFDCSASYTNTGGSIDRGLWQINDYWHPEISDSCAYDCQCNANGAYSISSKGSDWTPWATYNSGAYQKYMSAAAGYCGLEFGAEEGANPCQIQCVAVAKKEADACGEEDNDASCKTGAALGLVKCMKSCEAPATPEWYRKPLDGSTCTATGESCCGAPGGDVNNCPKSAQTDDCTAINSCCCG